MPSINQNAQAVIERRAVTVRELRAAADKPMTIRGYAALFNTLSEELWGFYEMIAPGAFTDALTISDARCLFNHEADHVLGRMSAGTLRVNEDTTGLAIECDLPDTQLGRDLATSIQRGDINQMSFAFTVEEDAYAYDGDKLIRSIIKIKELYDVAPVTYPGYADTSVSISAEARSKAAAMNQEHAARSTQAGDASGAAAGQVPMAVLRRRLELYFNL